MYVLILVAFLQSGPKMALEVFPTLGACQAQRAEVQAAMADTHAEYVIECGLLRAPGVRG